MQLHCRARVSPASCPSHRAGWHLTHRNTATKLTLIRATLHPSLHATPKHRSFCNQRLELSQNIDARDKRSIRTNASLPAKETTAIDFSLAVMVGGHDNLAECARFLVTTGIRPEDVDRILQEAVMYGADPEYASSPAGMAEHMRRIQPKDLQRAVSALDDLGMMRLNQLSAISRCPAILSPECDAPAAAEYLLATLQLDKERIAAMVASSPQVLTASLKNTLIPSWACLTKSFGFSPEEASKLIQRHPPLLADGELPGKVDLLCRFGMAPGTISELSNQQMAEELMVKSLREWEKKAEFATEILGISQDEFVASAFEFLAADFPTIILPRSDFARAMDVKVAPLSDLLSGSDKDWCTTIMNCDVAEYTKFRAKPETLRNFMFMLSWYDK